MDAQTPATDATDRLIAVYKELGHSRQDATLLAINLLGAYGFKYQREYRPVVLREAATAIDHLLATMLAPTAADRYASGLAGAAAELRRMADAA